MAQSLFNRGIKEHIISIEILDLNDGDPYFEFGSITSLEVIGVQYPNGAYKEITQSYKYQTCSAGGTWRIYEMEQCAENVPEDTVATEESMPYVACVISYDGIDLHSGPDSSYPKACDNPIPFDAFIDIYEETTAADGSLWGYTYFNGSNGWVDLARLDKVRGLEVTP